MIGLGVMAAARTVAGGGGGTTDPHFSNVVLLMHADGSSADSSSYARTATLGSGASIASSPAKFGSGAIALSGITSYVQHPDSADFDLLPGDYTIEAWAYGTSLSGFRYIWSNDGGTGALLLAVQDGTTLYHSIYGGTNLTFTCSLSTSTWHHIAVTRAGGTTRAFVDGTLLGSSATSLGSSVGTRKSLLGASAVGTDGFWQGSLDDVRLTKGVARYTADFSPPSTSHPDA